MAHIDATEVEKLEEIATRLRILSIRATNVTQSGCAHPDYILFLN